MKFIAYLGITFVIGLVFALSSVSYLSDKISVRNPVDSEMLETNGTDASTSVTIQLEENLASPAQSGAGASAAPQTTDTSSPSSVNSPANETDEPAKTPVSSGGGGGTAPAASTPPANEDTSPIISPENNTLNETEVPAANETVNGTGNQEIPVTPPVNETPNNTQTPPVPPVPPISPAPPANNTNNNTNTSLVTGQWEFAGWYGGGNYPSVVFDQKTEGKMYLVSDVTGVWKSDDKGENWKLIISGFGAHLAIAPSSPNVLYFSTEAGLYYSLDTGKTWNKSDTMGGAVTFFRPQSYRTIAVSSNDPARVCIGTYKGKVFCSYNYGRVWQEIPTTTNYFPANQPVFSLAFGNYGEMFAATNAGMLKYNFTSSSWSSLISGKIIYDLEVSQSKKDTVYAAGGNTLMISNDRGNTWKQSAAVPAGRTNRVIEVKSANKTGLYVVWEDNWNGGVIASWNDGANWTKFDNGLVHAGTWNSSNVQPELTGNPTNVWTNLIGRTNTIAVDPFNASIVFRGDYWGVWRSDNAGKNWKEKIKGAPNTVGSDIIFTPNGTLFVATMDDGLLRSSDMGKNYKVSFPITKYTQDTGGHVWRVKALDDKRIIATSSPWAVSINQILISNDSGKTFQIVRTGLPASRPKINTMWGQGYAKALAVDPTNSMNLYLGIDGDDGGGLFISSDGGYTWTRSSGQPGSLRVYNGLAVDALDQNTIYWAGAGVNGGIYISSDRGKTWKFAGQGGAWIFDIHVAKDGSIYAGADASGPTLFISRDKGVSWKKIKMSSSTSGPAEGIASSPIDPKIIAVGTVTWSKGADSQKILLSKDAGNNWTDITGDLPPNGGVSAMTFSNDGKYLYISEGAGGVYRTGM